MKIKIVCFLTVCALVISGCKKDKDCSIDDFKRITFESILDYNISSEEEIFATPGSDNQLPANTILVFISSEMNYGKLIITENSEPDNILKFIYTLYSPQGDVLIADESVIINPTYTFDFEYFNNSGNDDFWWQFVAANQGGAPGDPILFTPWNNAKYAICK